MAAGLAQMRATVRLSDAEHDLMNYSGYNQRSWLG
jgi:hypothetical protein